MKDGMGSLVSGYCKVNEMKNDLGTTNCFIDLFGLYTNEGSRCTDVTVQER